ncbi:Na/Pi cotransporter family protein [Urechidicola vernalis]|uniref:Na/Pi symporter n=1 Tax=Urechidicola vernalis TaxID=3075600 RepID=A0ABU2Y411_9FLAO|nr:Na/Pi symporter [Urechidicola sp. P050]MDT0552389.1 Na/Pi symporter [Urechidicola sp. P050]
MDTLSILISIIAAIGLFTHSLESFSNNLKEHANDKMQLAIKRFTDSKFKGLLTGFVGTGIIQSSSAVVAITVSFVDSGIISFHNSLPILLGSNLGTTITAWLVSFKIEALGITFLALGFILGYFKGKLALISKPIFYLGLILFSLDMIGHFLEPIKNSEELIHYLSYAAKPIIGVLLGALVTAICQSSSVTIGLTIILCSQQLLGLDSAIAIIVGSNIGTTSTAFIAAMKLDKTAKQTALANLIFNIIGVLIYLPLAVPYKNLIDSFNVGIAFEVALAHLVFNLIITILILPFTKQFGKLIQNRLMKS